MNRRMILYMPLQIVKLQAIVMLLPMAVGLWYGEASAMSFLYCALGALAVAVPATLLLHPENKTIYAKEGFVIVALTWLLMSALGALPFVISGEIPHFIDAFFETVSGFTTTGASILRNVEAMSKGMLFWRSFTHWLGGMGVLVLILAILPMTGDSYHMNIMKAESPGPQVSKLVPRLRDTARTLYIIYFVMTLLCVLTYYLSGMKLFDAFCMSFATAGTGGFAVLNSGLNDYSVLSQAMATIWMVLFGVSFNIYFMVARKDFKGVLKSEELRMYLGIIIVTSLIISVDVFFHCYRTESYGMSLHRSFFTVGSIMTTTGFAIADFSLWPEFSKMIVLGLMFIGACAGSTGGGIKVARLIILLKQAKKEIHLLFHPKALKQVQLEGKTVEHSVVRSVNNYMIIYLLVFVSSLLLVSLDKFDFDTNLSAVAATMNNIGPGFSVIGPYGSFAGFSWFSKIILTIDMLAGRLEILPILMLFHKNTWTRHF